MFEQKLGSARANAMANREPDEEVIPPTREEIKKATEEYLAKGGVITKVTKLNNIVDTQITESAGLITDYITPAGKLVTNVEEF